MNTEDKFAPSSPSTELLISSVFDAPRELVWQAMTDPERVVHWWGPRGFTTTIEEMDVRPGGTWKLVMHDPDGTDYPNESIFTEVVRPERLAYSLGGGKKGEPGIHFNFIWTFDALEPNRTKVTINMVFSSAADRDRVVREYGAIEGGEQTLERLGVQLVTAPVIVERTFNAPVEMVWEALTDRERMKEWYFDLEQFKPEPGCEFQFVVEHEGNVFDHRCKVTEVIPRKKLAYTWRYEGHEGDSLVTFELFAEGDKTRLKLIHEGLHTFPNTPPFAKSNFLQGWTALAGALGEFLNVTAS